VAEKSFILFLLYLGLKAPFKSQILYSQKKEKESNPAYEAFFILTLLLSSIKRIPIKSLSAIFLNKSSCCVRKNIEKTSLVKKTTRGWAKIACPVPMVGKKT
jgi:hypothetical protein